MEATLEIIKGDDCFIFNGKSYIDNFNEEITFSMNCIDDILKRSCKRVLLDLRHMKINSSIINQAKDISEYTKFASELIKIKIAILYDPSYKDLADF